MNNLKTSEEFVKGKHKIGYVSDSFLGFFKDRSFATASMPTFQKLTERISDSKIESTLKPGISSLGYVIAFMDNAPEECKDGYANVFYFPECVVVVFWNSFGGEWSVHTWDRDEHDWDAGRRIFSPATSGMSTEAHTSASDSGLVSILQRYCGERGDNEGATETLERIIRERDILLKNAIKENFLKLV